MARIAQVLDLSIEAPAIQAPSSSPDWDCLIPQISAAEGYLPVRVQHWIRPALGGDGLVVVVDPAGDVFIAALDVAGHGLGAFPALCYLQGWLRGTLKSEGRIPRLEEVASRLMDEMRRTGMEAAFLLVSITAHRALRTVLPFTYEAIRDRFPAPLLVVGPPLRTIEGAADRAAAGAVAIRHADLTEPWRLIIATDGLLQRLGAGDEAAGRRSLLRWQTGVDRDEPVDRRMHTSAPLADDESLWVVEWPVWELQVKFSVLDDSERHRTLRLIGDRLRNRLGVGGDEFLQAIAEAIENVRIHAYGGQDGVAAVRYCDEGKAVRVEIEDQGLVRASLPFQRGRQRGGLAIMEEFSDHLDVRNAFPTGKIVSIRREVD